jgi:hypothetical protein
LSFEKLLSRKAFNALDLGTSSRRCVKKKPEKRGRVKEGKELIIFIQFAGAPKEGSMQAAWSRGCAGEVIYNKKLLNSSGWERNAEHPTAKSEKADTACHSAECLSKHGRRKMPGFAPRGARM